MISDSASQTSLFQVVHQNILPLVLSFFVIFIFYLLSLLLFLNLTGNTKLTEFGRKFNIFNSYISHEVFEAHSMYRLQKKNMSLLCL